MNCKNCSYKLEDSFDKNEIEQLHKAVLGISKHCFEIKKLCVTVEVSVCTLAVTLFSSTYSSNEFLCMFKIVILLIPMLFYLVDICTYYYQDKLRYMMVDIENRIRNRHEVQLKNVKRFSKKNNTFIKRLFRSILAGPNIIYWGLIILAVLLSFFIQ